MLDDNHGNRKVAGQFREEVRKSVRPPGGNSDGNNIDTLRVPGNCGAVAGVLWEQRARPKWETVPTP